MQQPTLHILSIESLLARQLNLRMNAEQVKRLDEADVSAMSLAPHVERALMASVAVCTRCAAKLLHSRRFFHQEAQLRPEFEMAASKVKCNTCLV